MGDATSATHKSGELAPQSCSQIQSPCPSSHRFHQWYLFCTFCSTHPSYLLYRFACCKSTVATYISVFASWLQWFDLFLGPLFHVPRPPRFAVINSFMSNSPQVNITFLQQYSVPMNPLFLKDAVKGVCILIERLQKSWCSNNREVDWMFLVNCWQNITFWCAKTFKPGDFLSLSQNTRWITSQVMWAKSRVKHVLGHALKHKHANENAFSKKS